MCDVHDVLSLTLSLALLLQYLELRSWRLGCHCEMVEGSREYRRRCKVSHGSDRTSHILYLLFLLFCSRG